MKYKSTRDSSISLNSKYAIAKGISEEGGLYVPCSFPKYSHENLDKMKMLNYKSRAKFILKDFLTDFSDAELIDCIESAYSGEKFDLDNPAPVFLGQNSNKNVYILELWHGPTLAFKDIALQILPHLLTKSFSEVYKGKRAIIPVATSGDTGKAAMEGFKNVDGTDVIVFYPEDGVSFIQKKQMLTQEGKNVFVCGVKGNFDDVQSAIKNIFTNKTVNKALSNKGMIFSSANSINLARLLPQIVYYFSAYCDLMNNGKINFEGEKVNIVVPTGNFGNILAAYYAKRMGLPINKLICASNSNNVLDDFIRTGIYNRNRHLYTTISPSMDILVSSNLERLLYHLTDDSDTKTKYWMEQLRLYGKYEIDQQTKGKVQDIFYSDFCNENETKNYIRMMFENENYLCDPHTAVAVGVYDKYISVTNDKDTPTIIVSTASPYKFAESVLLSISNGTRTYNDQFEVIQDLSTLSGTRIPVSIENLFAKNIVFKNICNKNSILNMILKYLELDIEEV